MAQYSDQELQSDDTPVRYWRPRVYSHMGKNGCGHHIFKNADGYTFRAPCFPAGYIRIEEDPENVITRRSTLRHLNDLLKRINGKCLVIEFVKKDGSVRKMTGFTHGLEEDDMFFSFYDVDLNEYRRVNRTTLHWVLVDGEKYEFQSY